MSATTASTVTTQVYRVYIKATPEAIWDAITKPDWTERYGYGGRAEYEPSLRPGASYRGLTSPAMRAVGAPDVGVDGEVLEVDPPHRLVQTFRMVMDDRMTAEGFTRLTYEISPGKDGVTRLTLIHELEGAPTLALLMAGDMDDQGAGGGWSWVLSDLKSLLETGASMAPEDGLNRG
jgi:uncharacterized protein YndB with AHSA1/START domain